MFESIPSTTIRLTLHSCSGDFDSTVQKLMEYQKIQESKILKRPEREGTPFAASTHKLPQLQNEMNRLNEKNFSLLEQKIANQEADISLLKDMIKARDLTIQKLQKELQELRSLRDRETSSASVVQELAQSIKTNVDSSFKNSQEPNGVDFNKLVIEVKKQLAMSFLSDFKETKMDPTKSTISKMGFGSSFMNSPSGSLTDHIPNPLIHQDKPLSPNIPPVSNAIPYNLPTYPYFSPRFTPGYPHNTPYYNYPPTQPSAPYFPPTDPSIKPF